jgi:hypothetical protein
VAKEPRRAGGGAQAGRGGGPPAGKGAWRRAQELLSLALSGARWNRRLKRSLYQAGPKLAPAPYISHAPDPVVFCFSIYRASQSAVHTPNRLIVRMLVRVCEFKVTGNDDRREFKGKSNKGTTIPSFSYDPFPL